jgi:hypothetical protein
MTLGPQFEQLKMFMTPAEINPQGGIDAPETTDPRRLPSIRKRHMDHMMQWKRDAAVGTGLAASVAKEGVKVPVQVIRDPNIGNVIGHGHHRFAVSDPNALIPVIHTEGIIDAQSGMLDPWEAMEDYTSYMTRVGDGPGMGSTDSATWNPDPESQVPTQVAPKQVRFSQAVTALPPHKPTTFG